jgi:uncharacterized protein (DUF362 family)
MGAAGVSDGRVRVSIVRAYGDVERAVRQAIDHVGGIRAYVRKGDRVILKPNLAYPYPPPATTDPRVVQAVARLCMEAGAAEVGIGDSTSYTLKAGYGTSRYTNQDVIHLTGMDAAAEASGAKVRDFDRERWVKVAIPGGIVLKKAEIAAAMLESDVVIDIPAMKTHFETLVTLGIKNYHGILSDSWKIQYHKDEINQKLVDLHKAVKTHLTVMDGLLGMEGLGPRLGPAVTMDLILASSDVVALDAIASEVMGIRADEVETTRLAHAQGVGCGDPRLIEVAGEPLEAVRRPFARPDLRISGLFPGITVLEGGPCVHCYGRARIFLETLQKSGLPDNAGISHLLVGIRPPNPDLEDVPGKVVFVGDCALDGSSNLRYALGPRAVCMQGCPPIPSLHHAIERLKGATR